MIWVRILSLGRNGRRRGRRIACITGRRPECFTPSGRGGSASAGPNPSPPPPGRPDQPFWLLLTQANDRGATGGAAGAEKTSCSLPGDWGVQTSGTTLWREVSPGAIVKEGSWITVRRPFWSVRIQA